MALNNRYIPQIQGTPETLVIKSDGTTHANNSQNLFNDINKTAYLFIAAGLQAPKDDQAKLFRALDNLAIEEKTNTLSFS